MNHDKTRIGIMGGTFDPIHVGHLMIAENALEQYHLDQILFIPTGCSPHKDDRFIEQSAHRLEMLRLSIRDNPNFYISAMEINASGTSYTYLTLQKLKKKYPDWELYFIMGGDSLDYFDEWYHPEIICSMAKLLVAGRDDYNEGFLRNKINRIEEKYGATILPIDTLNMSISSRNIRQRVFENRTIRYLVPKDVEEYIDRRNLYKEFMVSNSSLAEKLL